MQKTISTIFFLAIFAVIRAQNNIKAVEDLSENEANDLSLLHKYNMFLKKILNYGVPFVEGKKSRDDIIKHFRDYPSTSRRPNLNHNKSVHKTKKNTQKDEDEIRKDTILLYYNKFLENMMKYGVETLNPVKETTNKDKAKYIDNDAEDYNIYSGKYKLPDYSPNKKRYTTSKGRPLFIAEFSTGKGLAQYQKRIKK